MRNPRLSDVLLVLLFGSVLLVGGQLFAGVTASISGTVTDATGAVVVGVPVSITNVDTGVVTTQSTNGQGFYSFQSVPLGKYTLEIRQTGFKAYRPDRANRRRQLRANRGRQAAGRRCVRKG